MIGFIGYSFSRKEADHMAKESLEQSIQTIYAAMRSAGYSERTINYYRQNYEKLVAYLSKNHIDEFTDQIGFCYLSTIM